MTSPSRVAASTRTEQLRQGLQHPSQDNSNHTEPSSRVPNSGSFSALAEPSVAKGSENGESSGSDDAALQCAARSERVVEAAAAAAASAAAAAAARAVEAAETARKCLQPWVVVDEYCKWRQLEQEESENWHPKAERLALDHLIQAIPRDAAPAIAYWEQKMAEEAAAATPSAAAGAAPDGAAATPVAGSATPGQGLFSLLLFGASGSGGSGSSTRYQKQPWGAKEIRQHMREELWAGVPDTLKCCVWLHANDAVQQLRRQPNLYAQVCQQAFGPPPFPESFTGRCPTFCGGLLGLEEDVSGVQIALRQLELEGDAPLASWRASGKEPEGTATPLVGPLRALRIRLPPPAGTVSSPSRRLLPVTGCGSRTQRNPLGQEIPSEFNFWPSPNSPVEQQQHHPAKASRGCVSGSPLAHIPVGYRRSESVDFSPSLDPLGGVDAQPSQSSCDTPFGGSSGRALAVQAEGGAVFSQQKQRAAASGNSTSHSRRGLSLLLLPSGAAASLSSPGEALITPQPSPCSCPKAVADDSPGDISSDLGAAARRVSLRRRMRCYDDDAISHTETLTADLFGSAQPDELQRFSAYMKDCHVASHRQAQHMQAATERSRDRVTFETALAAAVAAANACAAATDGEADNSVRKYNTASSLDVGSRGSFLHLKRHAQRNCSESVLLKQSSRAAAAAAAGGGAAAVRRGNTASDGASNTEDHTGRSLSTGFFRRWNPKCQTPKTQQPKPLLNFNQQQRQQDRQELGVRKDVPPSEASQKPQPCALHNQIKLALQQPWTEGKKRHDNCFVGRSLSNCKQRSTIMTWVKEAARSRSDACFPGTPLGAQGIVGDGKSRGGDRRGGGRRRSFISRLLGRMRRNRQRRLQQQQQKQRLDFLSNTIRAGGDPYATNALAFAAADAAVKDLRRRSSSSNFSEELTSANYGVGAEGVHSTPAAGLGRGASFPTLHVLPEQEAEEASSSPVGSVPQRQQQPQAEAPPLLLPPLHLTRHSKDESTEPLEFQPLECTPALLIPLPPATLDAETQQQRHLLHIQGEEGQFYPKAAMLLARSLSWQEQIEQATGTDVYLLEDVTAFHRLLDVRGRAAAKRLLWSLYTLFRSTLEFCPLIPHLTCLLLLYMSEAAAFAVLHTLVKRAHERDNEKQLLRLAVKRKDFIHLVHRVVANIRVFSPRLFAHMRLLGVDIAAWAARGLQDGFSRLLPFDFVLRIMGSFLFEGSIALCRYLLALLSMLEPELLACKKAEDAEKVLYLCSSDPRLNINVLSKTAMRMKTQMVWNSPETDPGLQSPYLVPTKIHEFYCIKPSCPSKIILCPAMWETLWRWLPDIYKYCNPELIFSSSHDGFSLTALVAKTEAKNAPTVCLIATREEEILGFYSPFSIRMDKRNLSFVSYAGAFVFQLLPWRRAYWWTGKNEMFLRVTPDSLIVGGDDVAIYLDGDLNHGRSRASASFDSAQLVSDAFGDFQGLEVEVWCIE